MTTIADPVEFSPAGNRVVRGTNVVNVFGPDQVGVSINPPDTTPDGRAWVNNWSNGQRLTKTADVDDAIEFADTWLWERT